MPKSIYSDFIIANFSVFLLIIGICAFTINYVLTKKILFIGVKRNLYSPSNIKDSHFKPTVALGGIPIFVVTLFTLLLIIGAGFNNSAGFFLASCFLLLMTGIKDDLVGSSARSKFLIQIFAAFLFVVNPDFTLGNLSGFLGFHVINPNYMTYCLGILFVVFITNAFNFIDGIDGLCASISIVCFIIFASVFYTQNEFFYCIFCVVLIGSLCSFLIFNFREGSKKMFLGDTGALLLGFLISIFALRIIELQPLKPFAQHHPKNAVIFILAILIIPIIDALRVIYLRIAQGSKPWTADRQHIHHMLLSKGYNHKEIVFLLGGLQLFSIVSIILLNSYNSITLHVFLILLVLNIICVIIFFPNKINIRKN